MKVGKKKKCNKDGNKHFKQKIRTDRVEIKEKREK